MLKSVAFALQTSSGHQMLGVHHSAMTTVHFGKIARKHGLTGVCLDLLSRCVALPACDVICDVKLFNMHSDALKINEKQHECAVSEQEKLEKSVVCGVN